MSNGGRRLPVWHWRSVSEALRPPGSAVASGEFPPAADVRPGASSRRTFLKLLGANAAVSSLAACSEPPQEKILPYHADPARRTPGVPVAYATSFVLDGHAVGLLVRSNDGRPTKIEGNPEHPASLGSTGVLEQASVLGVYDPHRARGVLHRGYPSGFEQFRATFGSRGSRNDRGRGFRILMEPQSSLVIGSLLERIRERYPEARVTFHSSAAPDHALAGAERVFGKRLQPVLRVEEAKVLVAFDSDFLSMGPMHLRYARQFASRRVPEATGGMNRLYAAEAMLSATGSVADHRLGCRSSDIAALAAALLASVRGKPEKPLPQAYARWVRAAANDLMHHRGQSLVVAGDRQPAEVHAACHSINEILDNVDKTVVFVEPTLLPSDQPLSALVAEMHAGRVDTLVMLDVNPVYTAEADLDFKGALPRVRTKALSSLYVNETAAHCDWCVPSAHYLESWGDARAYDGTLSIVQPLIAPLFEGRTAAEMLAVFAGDRESGGHDALIALYRARAGAASDFEKDWERILAAGFIDGTAFAAERVSARSDFDFEVRGEARGLEINFTTSPTVYDGRFANNVWLLELPSPITKLSWDNALLIGPATAKRLELETEDVVVVSYRSRKLDVPVLVVPGHAPDTATLHLGWGRKGSEQYASGVGADANRLRTSDAPEFGTGMKVEKTGRKYDLALTQTHWSLEARPHALSATLAELSSGLKEVEKQRAPLPSLVPFQEAGGPQWGMTIDLSKCVGCASCVVACQAENNVPTVGKDDVRRSREMYWLRIDTYYAGAPDAPDETVHQPMLCQHCEKAPCEYVCPVFATTHSPDGLNEMTYNRCIGTRFCSNNCPYKVRRFNWFDYVKRDLRELQRNPEVTVRERGVMEKCTYCVQRIRNAEIQARVTKTPLREIEIATACQQACPSRAITFGDVNDPSTEVSRSRKDRRAYAVLHDLNTRPRTRYLARIKNPSEELG